MLVKGGVVANCRCCNAIISHVQSAPDSANDAATSDTTLKHIPGPETYPNRQLPLLTKLLATTHAAAHTPDRACCYPRAMNYALSGPLDETRPRATIRLQPCAQQPRGVLWCREFSERIATFHVKPESLTLDPFASTRQSFASWGRPRGTGSRSSDIRMLYVKRAGVLSEAWCTGGLGIVESRRALCKRRQAAARTLP